MTRAFLLALAAGALLTVPVLAQTKDKLDDPYYGDVAYDDEIIVIAPALPQRPDRTASGARIVTSATSRTVSAADLDLRYDGDVAELRRRVRDTVVATCNDLERVAAGEGLLLDRTTACVRDTEQHAMAEVTAMTYAARG